MFLDRGRRGWCSSHCIGCTAFIDGHTYIRSSQHENSTLDKENPERTEKYKGDNEKHPFKGTKPSGRFRAVDGRTVIQI
jgi:hypothetical protein